MDEEQKASTGNASTTDAKESGSDSATLLSGDAVESTVTPKEESGKSKEDSVLDSVYGENPNETKDDEKEEVKEEVKEKAKEEVKEEDSKDESNKDVTYDLKLPEGIELDKEASAEMFDMFKSLKLDNDGAQKVMDHYLKTLNELATETKLSADKKAQEWRDQTMADKELGGDNLDKTVKLAMKGVNAVSPDGALSNLLTETGLGNHPQFIKAFKMLGESISEDSPSSVNSNLTEYGNKQEKLLSEVYGPNPNARR